MLVGIVGGGQLGRMLVLAGYPLGHRFRVLDPASDSPAGQVAHQVVGPYDNAVALAELADGCDVVTYEFENVPAEAARFLASRVTVFPGADALEIAQDRLAEKTLFRELGIGVPPFAAAGSEAELRQAIDQIGLPAVLKTRRLGYDGKGQVEIHDERDVSDAWWAMGERPAILEAFVSFDREVSIIGVRDREGRTAFYDVIENRHRDGILRDSRAPAPGLTPELQASAERIALSSMERLRYVGVLAIELFQMGDQLLASEMAPRVHNSGHLTIEGAETSQFENHVRAVTGMPLGRTTSVGPSGMVNLIGGVPDLAGLSAIRDVHVHLYGKEPRPGRKLGHLTVRAEDQTTLDERLIQIVALMTDENP